MTRTLVVVCADWPIRAAGHARSERPTAVFTHRGIVATNPAARAAGVQVGLRRREAQGRCPELLLVPDDPGRDARCFEPVVAALGTLTPQVEIIEPGMAALGTRGPSRYFGGDEALTRRVHHLVGETLTEPATVRVGVADGPLIARLAARLAAPQAPNVVAPGTAPAFVAPIPLSALTRFVADPTMLATCHQLGLTTLGEVAVLPTSSVLGRFGPDGVWLHRLARGVDPTTSSPTPIPAEVDEVIDFDPPETRADALAFAVRSSADTFIQRLTQLGLSCAQVVISLSTDHAEELQRRWRLDGPGRSGGQTRPPATLIAERVRWQVDGWLSGSAATRPSAGVIRVVLAPGEVQPARGTQLGFWGGASAADERAASAVARLEALVGPDAVCVVEPRGGRHPGSEAALVSTATVDLISRRHVPVVDDGDSRSSRTPPWPGCLPAPSPTTVLDTPHPVEVLDADGASIEVNGRGELRGFPSTLCRRDQGGAAVAICAWAGPWPVDERWWDPERRCRQARLQLVTVEDTAVLVTRQDRHWWLTAVYG